MAKQRTSAKLLAYGTSLDDTSANEVSVCSWNTLFKRWALIEDYPYLKEEHTKWEEFRLPKMRAKIDEINADIYCFQEIHKGEFGQDIGDYFKERKGYEYNANGHKKNRKDCANAVMWKSGKFEMVYHDWRSRCMVVLLQFKQISKKIDPKTTEQKDTTKKKKKTKPCLVDGTKYEYICVCNVHLEGDPAKVDTRFSQLKGLLKRIDFMFDQFKTLSRDDVAIIIAGDFNSHIDESLFKFLVEGKLSADYREPIFKDIQVTKKDAFHDYSFDESYLYALGDKIGERNPSYCGNMAPGNIDFIFYSKNCLTPKICLDTLPVGHKMVRENLQFPNGEFVSDHLPLVTVFDFESSASVVTSNPDTMAKQTDVSKSSTESHAHAAQPAHAATAQKTDRKWHSMATF